MRDIFYTRHAQPSIKHLNYNHEVKGSHGGHEPARQRAGRLHTPKYWSGVDPIYKSQPSRSATSSQTGLALLVFTTTETPIFIFRYQLSDSERTLEVLQVFLGENFLLLG